MGFGGQAYHKVELHLVPACGVGGGDGFDNFVIAQVFIDDIPQADRASFRGKGQRAFTDALHGFGDFQTKAIGSLARQRQGRLFFFDGVRHILHQVLELRIIGDAQRQQGTFFIARFRQLLEHGFLDFGHIILSSRQVDKGRVTKTAHAVATTAGFNGDTIMHGFHRWNQGSNIDVLLRNIHHAFIGVFVVVRDKHATNFGQSLQLFFSSPAFFTPFSEHV